MKYFFRLVIPVILIYISGYSYSQIDLDAKLPPASEELAKSFTSYLEINNKSNVRLGVLEFENNNEQTSELGVFLCNEMTTWLSLYANNKFIIVSRQDIDKIINEKEMATKYRTNKEKIEVLKKYSVVDYALTGTITQFAEQYRVNIRIVSTDNENAVAVAAVKVVNLNRTSDLDKMFSPQQENVKPYNSGVDVSTSDTPKPQSSSNNNENPQFRMGEILEGVAVGKTKQYWINNGDSYSYSILVNCKGKMLEVLGVTSNYFIDFYVSSSDTTVIIHFKYKSDGTGEYLSYTTKKK